MCGKLNFLLVVKLVLKYCAVQDENSHPIYLQSVMQTYLKLHLKRGGGGWIWNILVQTL